MNKGQTSFNQPKRLFIVNLCLFTCLVLFSVFIFTSESYKSLEILEPEIPAEPLFTRLELAYLEGEILGLSEHPDTMPEYQSEWVLKIATQEIQQNPAFIELEEVELKQLIQAFFDGYTARFDEYYSNEQAKQLGYDFGLKFNPSFHGPWTKSMLKLLNMHRNRLETEYSIQSEVEWRLFCKEFDKGYLKGFREIKDGVTVRSQGDEIKLFDE